MNSKLLVVVVAACASHLLATTHPKTGKAPATRSKPAELDPSVKRLPVAYAGDSIRDIYRRYAIEPKSEFETTEEYLQRTYQLPARLCAFVVSETRPHYDADSATMSFVISFRNLTLARTKEANGSYAGTNAFGVSQRVRRIHETEWALQMEASSEPSTFKDLPVITFHLLPDTARHEAGHIQLLALALVGPNSAPRQYHDVATRVTDHRYYGATIDSPIELTIDTRALAATAVAFWAFNNSTGEIYERVDAGIEERMSLAEKWHLIKGTSADDVRVAMAGEPERIERGSFGPNQVELWFYDRWNVQVALLATDRTFLEARKIDPAKP